MVKKIYNVKSIVLINSKENKLIVKFEKLLFYNENCFISFNINGLNYIFKVILIEEDVYLDPVSDEELILISNIITTETMRFSERMWAVGISYNEFSGPDFCSTRFKISNNNKPIDILPYLLQTGEHSIDFSN